MIPPSPRRWWKRRPSWRRSASRSRTWSEGGWTLRQSHYVRSTAIPVHRRDGEAYGIHRQDAKNAKEEKKWISPRFAGFAVGLLLFPVSSIPIPQHLLLLTATRSRAAPLLTLARLVRYAPAPPQMRIVIHDYAGHTFAPSLSRELAARGHHVVHAFAGSLQTPRGELRVRDGDPGSLSFHEVPMDAEYVRYKYSFLRRRKMEIRYGKEAARFIAEWKPDAVISGNTPTEAQGPIVQATVRGGGRFYYWVQDFYSLAVDKLVRKKLPLAGIPIGAWYRSLDRRQFRDSAKVIAITEDFAPVLSKEFGVDPSRVAVIPNWALIEEIPSLPKDNAWSRKHGLHDKFVFLYTGTIGMKHNPGLLLELARHHAGDPEVRVVVVS
ncbi:MAG: hypothetical protein EOP87_18430, partial [Verrucomicrobiaceae bacterium]